MLLFAIGPAAYVLEIRAKHLGTPWYVPILATAGAALMVMSLWRRRGIARAIGLVFFTLVCGFEWFMLLVAFRSPAYTGPAQPGRALPAFTASLADGGTFTEKDLAQGTSTVLLFFRGRW
jgi:hypothetical protein